MIAMARIASVLGVMGPLRQQADGSWRRVMEGDERSLQGAMAELYRNGFGYHAIADLAGREHEELFGLLTSNWPGRRMARWTE